MKVVFVPMRDKFPRALYRQAAPADRISPEGMDYSRENGPGAGEHAEAVVPSDARGGWYIRQ